MEINTTTRNKDQARKIESWILNQIAIRGASNVAKALGMDKSGITRWKESMLPKLSMLLAVLEWGVVDDDMARLDRRPFHHRQAEAGRDRDVVALLL